MQPPAPDALDAAAAAAASASASAAAPVVVDGATVAASTAATRPGYRGRCLYKTGKCTNERALKTSGAPHNLCEEHRSRQNQHQRKLDAKNRVARKDKRPAAAGAAAAHAPPTSATAARFPPFAAVKKLRTESGELAAGLGAPAAHGSLVDLSATAAGVVFLPNGPQPPQLSLPLAIQDFDGIVVPIPSYVEPHERADFRARVYQKVLDYISEECVLRFSGARAPETKPDPTPAADSVPDPSTARASSDADVDASRDDHQGSSSGTASEHDDDLQDEGEGATRPTRATRAAQ